MDFELRDLRRGGAENEAHVLIARGFRGHVGREERATRVRAVMVKLGASVDMITVVGHGRSSPRDAGASESAHERNRRVEFVIDRKHATKVTAELGAGTP